MVVMSACQEFRDSHGDSVHRSHRVGIDWACREPDSVRERPHDWRQ